MPSLFRSLLFLLSLPAAILPPSVSAQGSGSSSSGGSPDALAHLPKCALPCFLSALSASPCSATDTTCICTNQQFMSTAQDCLSKACYPKDLLIVRNMTAEVCGEPVRNIARDFPATAVSLVILTTVLVVIRFWVQIRLQRRPLGAEDWLVVAAQACAIELSVAAVVGLVWNGLGQDMWAVPADDLAEFGLWVWTMQLTYFSCMSLFKFSLLFFFLGIFPKIRRLIWATIAFNSCYLVTFLVFSVAQCSPPSYFWRQYSLDPTIEGSCLDGKVEIYTHIGIGIALDFWMLLLPLLQLKGLQLHWKKKAGVALMFCVGTFVTVISILRLIALIDFRTENITYDFYPAVYWSVIEADVGIICACMPALRTLLVRLMPGIFGTKNCSQRTPGGPRLGGADAAVADAGPGAAFDVEAAQWRAAAKLKSINSSQFSSFHSRSTGGGSDWESFSMECRDPLPTPSRPDTSLSHHEQVVTQRDRKDSSSLWPVVAVGEGDSQQQLDVGAGETGHIHSE